jgi:hypothetical protein
MKQPSICDFKGCNNTVQDERKVVLSRFNPWRNYLSFQACDICTTKLKGYLTLKLKRGI